MQNVLYYTQNIKSRRVSYKPPDTSWMNHISVDSSDTNNISISHAIPLSRPPGDNPYTRMVAW